MNSRRALPTLFKTLVILALAFGVLLIYRTHRPLPAPVGGGDNDEDDVKYAPVVPVSVAPLQLRTVREFIWAYGTVTAEPALPGRAPAATNIGVIAPGTVSRVGVVEGQQVAAGQFLFQMDTQAIDARIEAANRALAAADADVNRLVEGVKNSPGSEEFLPRARLEQDRARTGLADAQTRKAMLTISAPFAGTVAELLISPGEIADPAKPAMRIINLDLLTVAVSIPGPQLRTISVGQEAEVADRLAASGFAPSTVPTTEPADSGVAPTTQPQLLRGKIVFIDPLIDSRTGLGQAFVSLPAGSGLRPGQFEGVRIIACTHVDALVAPAESIVRNANGEAGVSVVVRDFQWAFRHPVHVGITDGDWVEVEGPGLKPGENVVTTGAFALPDQSRISVR